MSEEKESKIAVLIAAYNESEALGELLESLPFTYQVYVVDDGSTDGTSQIAEKRGAEVIKLPFNLGQGAASIVGYKLLSEMEYDYVVKMDGDGQHDPAEIPKMMDKLVSSGADIVVGSRVRGSTYRNASLLRRWLLLPLTKFLNLLTGYSLTDSMSSFKIYKGSTFARLTKVFDRMLEPQYAASEFWLRFAEAGLDVVEVPMNLKDREEGKSRKGSIAIYGFGIIKAIVRTKLDLYKLDSNEH